MINNHVTILQLLSKAWQTPVQPNHLAPCRKSNINHGPRSKKGYIGLLRRGCGVICSMHNQPSLYTVKHFERQSRTRLNPIGARGSTTWSIWASTVSFSKFIAFYIEQFVPSPWVRRKPLRGEARCTIMEAGLVEPQGLWPKQMPAETWNRTCCCNQIRRCVFCVEPEF